MQIIQKGGKYGLNDAKNQQILACEYEKLSPILPTLNKRSVDMYDQIGKKEYVCVQQNNLFGVFGLDGALILPCEYEAIGRYAINDLFTVRQNGKWGVINREKAVVLPFEYDELGHFFVGEGIIAKKGGFYGIMGKDELEVVPFVFDLLRYEEPADGNLRYPHWLLYEVQYQQRPYAFAEGYLPVDLSIYGPQTQLTARFSGRFCEYVLNVSTADLPLGKIQLRADGQEWEEVTPNRYEPVKPENSYKYALDQLCERLEAGEPVDAEYLQATFGGVYTWSYIFWDYIRPFIREDNQKYVFDCIAELMLVGLRKNASKADGAVGRRSFYEQGLRIIHDFTSLEVYEQYCQYMLNALKSKNLVKHNFLLDCFF